MSTPELELALEEDRGLFIQFSDKEKKKLSLSFTLQSCLEIILGKQCQIVGIQGHPS